MKKKQPTEAQKAAAAAKRDHVRALWQKIADMEPLARQALFDQLGAVRTCAGHELTINNTLLLNAQMPTVSIVGGFHQWKDQGRRVSKGARALCIWIPTSRKDSADGSGPTLLLMESSSFANGATESTGSSEKRFSRFVLGSVFDISQTEPIPGQIPGEVVDVETFEEAGTLAFA